MKKRLLAVLLIGILAVSGAVMMTSCGGSGNGSERTQKKREKNERASGFDRNVYVAADGRCVFCDQFSVRTLAYDVADLSFVCDRIGPVRYAAEIQPRGAV